jgi:hypothetical protein
VLTPGRSLNSDFKNDSGLLILSSTEDRDPKPIPNVKSVFPSLLLEVKYSELKSPVPAKSLNPIASCGK